MASGSSDNNDRPYSLSKDEALARMLQEEEYDAAQHDDEQFARQLQRNMMYGTNNGPPTNRSVASLRQPERAMTPITQLFSSLMSASLERNPRQTRRSLGLLPLSSDEEDHNDSDNSDSSVEEESQVNTERTIPPIGRGRGSTRGITNRGRLGYRPTETVVNVTSEATGNSNSDTPRSIFSTGSENSSSRTSSVLRGRPPRGTNLRGTRRGTTTRRTSTNSTSGSESGENGNRPVAGPQTRTQGRTVAPRSMEPSVPPLSLAMNQPELPEGEVEPEFLILENRGSVGTDGRFVHIMRDPMLLLLFLMGRAPQLMVPDDIDPTDYEALWELAERIGEVKNRGLNEDELKTLKTKKYTGKTRFNVEGPQCQVCLTAYKNGELLVNLPCKHEYHDKCIKEWLKRNASCPICRHDMKKESS